MEVQHHSRISLILVVVNYGKLLHLELKHCRCCLKAEVIIELMYNNNTNNVIFM